MRAGVWNEEKILFKNSGHDHRGGHRGAHIDSRAFATSAIKANKALGTGCVQIVNPRATLFATNVAKCRMWFGQLTKTRVVATTYTVTFGGATGFTAIDWVRVEASRSGRVGTIMLYNYLGRATALYGYLSATLGMSALASAFVEVWGR